MKRLDSEPAIRVGLMTGAASVRFTLAGGFVDGGGDRVPEGDYTAWAAGGAVRLEGSGQSAANAFLFLPADFERCRFTVHDVTIGVEFHWQREESQQFQGALKLVATPDGLTVINELPIESYLVSVISSEMSASCPPELLRAHAIVSRSWLLAQLQRDKDVRVSSGGAGEESSLGEVIRWYGRESHHGFDVCADDHCQRYQGISKAFSATAHEAVRETAGTVLMQGREICDTRYSKTCGGMTELYRSAWGDRDVGYLTSVYDGAGEIVGYELPLTIERNADAWITSAPPAYCNTRSAELLGRILPGFDQETPDFYRWRVRYTQDELRDVLRSRLGFDPGGIRGLEPVERGASGRLVRLRIVSEHKSLVIGKELEIRRALSRSHLYSSAFVVRSGAAGASGCPDGFELIGAGWGHGVGLCQIGAAVMADIGCGYRQILAHYFRGASLESLDPA